MTTSRSPLGSTCVRERDCARATLLGYTGHDDLVHDFELHNGFETWRNTREVDGHIPQVRGGFLSHSILSRLRSNQNRALRVKSGARQLTKSGPLAAAKPCKARANSTLTALLSNVVLWHNRWENGNRMQNKSNYRIKLRRLTMTVKRWYANRLVE